MSSIRIAAMLVGLLLATVAWAGARDAPDVPRTIILAADLEPGTPLTRKITQFYEAVFARAGLGVELRMYPVKRGILEAAAGKVDGDFFRVASSGDRFGTLVRVDVAVAELAYGMYSMRGDLPEGMTAREMLYFEEILRLGRVRGNHNVEVTMEGLGFPVRHDTIAVADEVQGMRMLAKGRLDVLFATDIVARVILRSEEFRYLGIHRVGDLCRRKGYIYLHRSNAHLVPALERALREAHTQGLLGKILGESPAFDPG